MDASSDYILRFLGILAVSDRMLSDLASQLKGRAEVIETDSIWECRHEPPQPFPMLDGVLEARMRNGKALRWSLHLEIAEEIWRIDPAVSVSGDGDPAQVIGFPG